MYYLSLETEATRKFSSQSPAVVTRLDTQENTAELLREVKLMLIFVACQGKNIDTCMDWSASFLLPFGFTLSVRCHKVVYQLKFHFLVVQPSTLLQSIFFLNINVFIR